MDVNTVLNMAKLEIGSFMYTGIDMSTKVLMFEDHVGLCHCMPLPFTRRTNCHQI